MSQLDPNKLHVRYLKGVEVYRFSLPRRYTLTHSDMTGDLFLTIGLEYDIVQTSGFYTRLMRDEVFAEWRSEEGAFELHLFCHVSGGIVIGPAGWRYRIFQQHMPLVLESLRYGEREIFQREPKLDSSKILVHFISRKKKYALIEDWGVISRYR